MRVPISMKVPPRAVVRALEGFAGALGWLQRAVTPAPATMMQAIVEDFVVGRCLFAVVELGVVDRITQGPASVDEIARDVGADADTLHRVLRLLASRGVFAELGDRRFASTRLSDCLRADGPASLAEWARYNDTDRVWPSWGSFLGTMKNGRSLYENAHGAPFFAWLEQNPDLASRFDRGMGAFSTALAPTVVAAYDFGRLGSLVDVAGGQGALLAALLHEHPRLAGTLFDLPGVIERARRSGPCADPRIGSRCAFAEGDMFEGLPAGKDAYLLKWILHDWQDDACQRVLAACRRAMTGAHQRLLVVEMVVEERKPSTMKLTMDVVMLTLSGGRERTLAEYRTLLRRAGFELTRVVHTVSPLSVLEARPA